MAANPLAGDLDSLLDHTRELWDCLRGERLFITGGTGFFGCWLLESLAWANDRLGLDAQAVVLTRSLPVFQRKAPHLAAHPAIHFHQGDVRDFEFPAGHFAAVVHAAAPASARLNSEAPLEMLDTIVAGTRRVLDFASQCGATRCLLVSSGGVYGRQPPDMPSLPEDYPGAPDPLGPLSAYGEGKRMAELLGGIYARQTGLEVGIARGFTFVGPYLPLDAHFAIGNFIRDGLGGGPVQVSGDGTAIRSYLYASDLAAWLWTILFKGPSCRPYNVGSEEAISIASLAQQVSHAFQPVPEVVLVQAPTPGAPAERYVPLTRRAQQELGLRQWVSLDEAIRRTAAWARETQ